MAASKPGKHIRYQARGRGFSLNTLQAGFGIMGAVNAAKTIAKGGVGALVKQEKEAAKERGPIQQVHRATAGLKNVSVASKAAAAAKGKGGAPLSAVQRAQVQARAMESLFTTGSIGGTSATQTGRGMELLPSTGGGFRASELVGSNIGSTIARILLFTASQTTLGSLIGSIWFAAAGKSMFDSAFANPQALATRRQNDLAAFADVARVSDRVTIAGGREAQVMGVETVDGNTRMTLRVAGQNGAADTNFTVVVNSQGVVRQIEMQIQVPGPDGQSTSHNIVMRSSENTSGTGVWIRVPDPNHPGQTIPQQVPATSYYEQTRDARGNITEIPLAPALAGDSRENTDRLNQMFSSISTTLASISPNFTVGRSTEIVADYNNRQGALSIVRSTVITDYQTEMAERSRSLGETVPHNIIDRAANDYAGRAIVGLLHVNSTLGVSGDPVATQQAMLGGREPAQVIGAITTAYDNSLGSDLFRSRLSNLLGDRVDVEVVMSAMAHLSPSALGGTRASVRDAVVEQILVDHPELKGRANDIRAAFSERQNAAPVVDLIRNTATNYRNALVDSGLPQVIIDGSANQSLLFTQEAVRVGREVDPSVRYTDNAGLLLARTDQTQLPSEVVQQVAPFAILQHGANAIANLPSQATRPNQAAEAFVAVSNACQEQNAVYAQASLVASPEGRSVLGEKYNMTAEASHHLSYSTGVVASTGFAPTQGQVESAISREHEELEQMRTQVNDNLRAGNFSGAMEALQSFAQRAQLLGDEHDSTIALNALGAVAAARDRADFNANDPENQNAPRGTTYQDSQAVRTATEGRIRVASDVAGQLAGLNEEELARRSLFNSHIVATENARVDGMVHELNEGHTDGALLQLENWRSSHIDRCRLNGTNVEDVERAYEGARDIILRSNRSSSGRKTADTRAEDLDSTLRGFDLRTTMTTEQIDGQARMMSQLARLQPPPDGEDPPTDDQIRRRVVASSLNYSASATATYHAADEYAGTGVMAITKAGRRP
jgi:hypothetical protein